MDALQNFPALQRSLSGLRIDADLNDAIIEETLNRLDDAMRHAG